MKEMKEKYEENKEVAYKLKELEYYNASMNRFYYSIYQKIMVYILNYNMNINTHNDPHKNNLNLFLCIFIKNNSNMSNKQISDIKNYLFQLKRLRVRADYLKDERISENDIKDAELKYKVLDKIIDI